MTRYFVGGICALLGLASGCESVDTQPSQPNTAAPCLWSMDEVRAKGVYEDSLCITWVNDLGQVVIGPAWTDPSDRGLAVGSGGGGGSSG